MGFGGMVGVLLREAMEAEAEAEVEVELEVAVEILVMQKRRSEAEIVKREGRVWKRVATLQITKRTVKRSLSSAAQEFITTQDTNNFFLFCSPPPLSFSDLSFPIVNGFRRPLCSFSEAGTSRVCRRS
ncbi:hypothetical protein OIU77_022736, partial [Salix suchowensis]